MLQFKIGETNQNEQVRELQIYLWLGNPINYKAHENDRFSMITEGFLDENLNIYARPNIKNEHM